MYFVWTLIPLNRRKNGPISLGRIDFDTLEIEPYTYISQKH